MAIVFVKKIVVTIFGCHVLNDVVYRCPLGTIQILRKNIYRILDSPPQLSTFKHIVCTENKQKLAFSDPPPPPLLQGLRNI